uniref:Uncharacterized protein n=1 Tax=viral metagenome TaxID=1070528 RepID=A0A6C0AEH1_9ZZZZ
MEKIMLIVCEGKSAPPNWSYIDCMIIKNDKYSQLGYYKMKGKPKAGELKK